MTKEDLEGLIDCGLSISQIAKQSGLGKSTVRYWLDKHGLRTKHSQYGKLENPDPTITRTCKTHGETEFYYQKSHRGYRCRKCVSSGSVVRNRRRRREIKRILVIELGGECSSCGYSKNLSALEFHHTDPTTKTHTVGVLIRNRLLNAAREEAKKCILLCSCCHAEVEHPEDNDWDNGR